MTARKQRKYLDKVDNDAENKRKSITVRKTHAYDAFKRGKISQERKDRIYKDISRLEKAIKDYRDYYKNLMKKIKGEGMQKGRGVYFYNDAKELLQKLTLIIGEIEAGNTSIEMRNMGVSILDTLLKSKAMNKGQYQKLVKKYFKV